MKYTANTVKKNISTLQNSDWYHQRFDGCPFFLHFISEAESTNEPRKHGWVFEHKFCFFNNDRADWYIYMPSIQKITKEMLSELKKNSHLSRELIAAWEEDKKKFYELCSYIEIITSANNNNCAGISKLQDRELFELTRNFITATIKTVTSSSIIDGFALGSDEILADKIKVFLKTINRGKEFTKIFPVLTAPTRQSFINKAEISLLKVALLSLQHSQEYHSALMKHQQQYFWSKNNYVHNNMLTVEHFEREVNHILEEYKTAHIVKEEIKKIESIPQKNKSAKELLIKDLKLSDEITTLLTISDDFTYWQDERKKATYLYIHYGCVLLEEIGKRINISLHELKYMTSTELLLLLEGKITISGKELQQRIKNCVYYWNKDEFECIIDKGEIEQLKKIIQKKEDYSMIKELKGLCASSGKAKGKVKIITSATECGKVEKGDILVAVMTRPDYITGMKKAAAIVTNEGGVTCHAAIVSRELNIPCIIGTKIATEVLKEGMVVEVDANIGVVRILR